MKRLARETRRPDAIYAHLQTQYEDGKLVPRLQ